MNQKIGFISLMPDSGHVIPLLRLAAAFAERNYDVVFYLPDECKELADDYKMPVQLFGPVTKDVNMNVFIQLSKKSIFYNVLSNYKDLNENYIRPIAMAVIERIESIKELMAEDGLSLIIADENVFRELYMKLSAYLNVDIAFHVCVGNYRFSDYLEVLRDGLIFKVDSKIFRLKYHRFTFNYGFTDHLFWIQKMVLRMADLGFSFIRKKVENKIKQYMNALQKSYDNSFPAVDINHNFSIEISSGLPFIERGIIQKYYNYKKEFNLFAPLKDKREVVIRQTLKEWIDGAGGKPIVYICLGTMVRGNKNLILKILNGLKDLDVKILWAAPKDQINLIKNCCDMPNLRVEADVPQSQILALDKICCFITHAGAGGIQDGFVYGKPMLCIPFMFDQPFNSSVVELLGVGIKIWKNRLTGRLVRNSIEEIIHNRKYWDTARLYKEKIQNNDSGIEIIKFLKKKNILKNK